MLLAIVGVGVVLGLVTFGMYAVMRWGVGIATQELVSRLRAGESIVNDERVPEAWVAPYRTRIAAMRKAGKSQDDIDRVGLKALDYCLRQIDDLIRFYEKANVVDTADTRDVLLEALRDARERWRKQGWRVMLTPHEQPERE